MSEVKVGRELRDPMGWMLARTKRLADLLLLPNILRGATDIVEGLDRWCEHNGVDEGSVLLGDAIFVKGLQYVEYPLLKQ